jgi:hypothetical protein
MILKDTKYECLTEIPKTAQIETESRHFVFHVFAESNDGQVIGHVTW